MSKYMSRKRRKVGPKKKKKVARLIWYNVLNHIWSKLIAPKKCITVSELNERLTQ